MKADGTEAAEEHQTQARILLKKHFSHPRNCYSFFHMQQKLSGSGEKIFCIGLHKSGTTSLHFALEALGYRSIHTGPHILREIYADRAAGRPLLANMIHEFDAFGDVAVPRFYKELDKLYPDAKFILTVRDPEAQYRSWVEHSRDENEKIEEGFHRMTWTAPFHFFYWRDRVRFFFGGWRIPWPKKRAVRQLSSHVKAVQDHFSGRPDKLLLLDIFSEPNPWTPLCRFLGRTVPETAFPKSNPAGGRASNFIRLSPAPLIRWDGWTITEGSLPVRIMHTLLSHRP